jgi:arginyl-tRNA synthetase
MNQWVYDGATTYKNLGVDFDAFYYESNTFARKDVVQIGFDKRFSRKIQTVRFGLI